MGASDGLTLRDIARRIVFPKQTMNSAVAKMQCDGLVVLESAEGSRKEKSVRLTDTGRAPMMTAWRVSANRHSSSTTSTTSRSRSRCGGIFYSVEELAVDGEGIGWMRQARKSE